MWTNILSNDIIFSYCIFRVITKEGSNKYHSSEIFIKSDKYVVQGTLLSKKVIKSNLECASLCMKVRNCSMIMITPTSYEQKFSTCSSNEINIPGNITRMSDKRGFDVW